jgi:hypothetical protein
VKKAFFILLFCCAAFTSKCQFIDSLQSATEKKGSFSFDFNTRNSTIDNNDATIFGYMLGVSFGNKFVIGGGFDYLSNSTPVYQTTYIGNDAVKERLNFFFFSYFVEYIINLTKHWRIDVPVAMGFGGSSYQYSLDKIQYTESGRGIVNVEPEIELDYNFNKYIGLYTQVGYRLMLVNNPLIHDNFNSVTYSVGLLISPLEIYADIFPNTKLAKMIESGE